MTKTSPIALAALLLAVPAAAQVVVPSPQIAAPTAAWTMDVDDDGVTRVERPAQAGWTVDIDDGSMTREAAPQAATWTVDIDDDGVTRIEVPARR